MAAGSGRIGNEDVAGAASEAFVRWLHHQYAPIIIIYVCPGPSVCMSVPTFCPNVNAVDMLLRCRTCLYAVLIFLGAYV